MKFYFYWLREILKCDSDTAFVSINDIPSLVKSRMLGNLKKLNIQTREKTQKSLSFQNENKLLQEISLIFRLNKKRVALLIFTCNYLSKYLKIFKNFKEFAFLKLLKYLFVYNLKIIVKLISSYSYFYQCAHLREINALSSTHRSTLNAARRVL